MKKVVVILGVLLGSASAYAQNGTPFNERDDQYRLLGLKRAKEAFEIARAQLDRQEELFRQELLSQEMLDSSKRLFSEAEVNYQQSLLAVLFEQQYVAVMGAVKYQNGDGRKHVRLELENTSGGGAELKRLTGFDDEIFNVLRPDVVHDVYVSLANDDGAIISQPYEAKLEELRYGSPGHVDFALLQEVDAVTVQLAYGKSAQRSVKIFLQKDESVDRVEVQSEQFSQEVELGSSATFDLTLELFSGTNDTYKLEVVGLPKEIHRYFVEPASNARLSQFKFTESTRTREAGLQVFLPDRDSEQVPINQPMPFWVLVIPREERAALGNLSDRRWNDAEIEKLGVGAVRLELLPRGVGELRVKAPLLYFQTDPGKPVEIALDIINEGTGRLDNIELDVDPPFGWEKRVEPALISSLGIGEEEKLRLFLTPTAEAAVGKYETRIRTTSFADNQPIEAEDKMVTVEIQPQVNVLPSVLLISALIGVILMVVIFGVRLARR